MLTREEIEKMEAGPELDTLVAERVMGWERRRLSGVAGCWWSYVTPDGKEGRTADCWKPSEDIAAAWEVVGKLRERKLSVEIRDYLQDKGDWDCGFYDLEKDEWFAGQAPTAPLAVCRAALLAVMERVP